MASAFEAGIGTGFIETEDLFGRQISAEERHGLDLSREEGIESRGLFSRET